MPAPINSDPIPLTPLEGLSIIYDDEDLVVIDKPVGCAAHPSPGWTGPTVVGALMAAGYSVSTSGPAERQGIVHRLDVGTSGLMIVAKSDQAFHALKDAFRNRTVSKIYHALVQGHMDPSTGTIDAPIDRHPKEDHRFAVVATGKESITHYEVMEFYRAVSMVKIELETGRTHQIRVHFSALHHPLVGDTTYGADPVLGKSLGMSRPWLHAAELSFSHPVTQAKLNFKAPYPSDLTGSLALLSDAVLP
jgi:23S rRNA pseudouridine1911/1915/1917 synthase